MAPTQFSGPTPDQLDKYKSKIGHQHARIEQLKNRYETLFHARKNSSALINALKLKQDLTERDKSLQQQGTEYVQNLEAQMNKILSELKAIAQKQRASDDDYITFPIYGENDTPDFIALNSLPSFDPSQEVPTLYHIWQLITEFSQSMNLSEKGFRTVLVAKLKGKALTTYLMTKDKPIKDIIILLKDQFGSFPTKETLEQDYNNFSREHDESIKGAISRFHFIIKNLYKDLSHEEIESITNRETLLMIKRIVKPEILTTLEREISRAREIGSPLEYDAMLQIAHNEELLLAKQTKPNKFRNTAMAINSIQKNDTEEQDETNDTFDNPYTCDDDDHDNDDDDHDNDDDDNDYEDDGETHTFNNHIFF